MYIGIIIFLSILILFLLLLLYRGNKINKYYRNVIEKTILTDNLVDESISTLSVAFGIPEEDIPKILLERKKNDTEVDSKN